MAASIYLAMTAAEFAACPKLPEKTAWMDCHFSAGDTGLSGLPPALPPHSMLILHDQTPMGSHDPDRIAVQLTQAVETLACCGVVLDFERPAQPAPAALARQLAAALPCPVAVSEGYAQALDCPVFLSPCPHHVPLKDHISPWAGRELWLDLALDAACLTLTEGGCALSSLPYAAAGTGGFADARLHCHYRVETGADFARFILWRTRDDLDSLAEEAKVLGIRTFLGLWQELG